MKNPADNGRNGKEIAQVTNNGQGMSKGGAGGSGGGPGMGKFHDRPASTKGTEFSVITNKGDGLSK